MSLVRKLFPLALALVLLGGAIQGVSGLRSEPEVQGDLKPTSDQLDAAEEIAAKLKHHYRRLEFDDTLSSQVLDSYLKDLDPNRQYFLATDIREFERYRDQLDDQLSRGQLEAGYTIFNRFQERLETRLGKLLDTIKNDLDSLTFDDQETVVVDREDPPWAANEAELDAIWHRQLKNAVLSMRLNDSSLEDIRTRLTRRYESQLKRITQNTPEDVFQVYINALTQTFDPHTTYFTPHNSENFDISMSRSLEGIGAVLQYEDGYTKVVRLVPGGPAAKSGQLKPADRIVGVGQDGETPEPVIGLRLDEVVDQIRGPKGTKVNLEIIPAGSAAATMLARKGWQVTVLEREKFPRDHVGESLLPASIPVLEELGALPAVESAGFLPKYGATMVWGSGDAPWSWYFKETSQRYPHSYQVWRPQFDQILLDNAKAQGVTVLEGHHVTEVIFDGGEAVGVEFTSANGETTTDTIDRLGNLLSTATSGPLVQQLTSQGRYSNLPHWVTRCSRSDQQTGINSWLFVGSDVNHLQTIY